MTIAADLDNADPTPSPAPASAVVPRTQTEMLREAAYREAGRLYGGDDIAGLRALAAGTHPLQRPALCAPDELEKSMRLAAETVDALARRAEPHG